MLIKLPPDKVASYYISGQIISKKSMPAKRSLDFSSPSAHKTTRLHSELSQNQNIINETESLTINLLTEAVLYNKNQVSSTQTSLTCSLEPLEEATLLSNSNKRTAEELFGDIDDINFDDVELPSKRQKTDEENDFDLINKIIECRTFRQMISKPKNGPQSALQPNYNLRDNISLDIPK